MNLDTACCVAAALTTVLPSISAAPTLAGFGWEVVATEYDGGDTPIDDKIAAIKFLRAKTGMSLSAAKDLVDEDTTSPRIRDLGQQHAALIRR